MYVAVDEMGCCPSVCVAMSFFHTSLHCLNPQTNEVFSNEGATTVDGEFPLGTTCEFRGAATPLKGDAHCLDPAAIQYDVTSCQVEGE